MPGDVLVPGVHGSTVFLEPTLATDRRDLGGKATLAGLRQIDPELACLTE